MTDKKPAFFAYPGSPADIGQSVKKAVSSFNSFVGSCQIEGWEQNDISGVPLVSPIFSKISEATFLAADITYLNENVAFEIGYAIGCKKRSILFVNTTHVGDRDLANAVGIFDTLGYEQYANSADLTRLLRVRNSFEPLKFEVSINHQQPIYIVEPPRKNDAHLMLVSRTKKARWKYRSFNPDEDIRLSGMDAVRHVAQSAGVIAPLQSLAVPQAREHNLRAMFVAGLSTALEIPTLIIQPWDFVTPLDVRDLSRKYKHPDDISDAVQSFSLEVTEFSQKSRKHSSANSTILTNLTVGDPTAENEMTTLYEYYLATDEYQRALRGEVNLVVGRKGSGKTALFVQLRDVVRRHKPNIVVDLKPEGFQLIKLKERVLDFLGEGAQQHLITAFWEYILLLEISYKALEKDRENHLRDHILAKKYEELRAAYGATDLSMEGDFRERLSKLSDELIHQFLRVLNLAGDEIKQKADLAVTTSQVTEILYKHDIHKLRAALVNYLRMKEDVWLLFDNIDKGWSVEGVSSEDLFILRCLINAARKLERELKTQRISFHSIVFVRDDVYTLLMGGTADYGKEMRASLDWSDPDLLGEVLKRRIQISLKETQAAAPESWSSVCISHYGGEPWLQFMAGHALMRPRNLLKLFRYCLGYAINSNHLRIEEADITRGLKTYAQDLVLEVDRELSDVFPKARKLIYEFSEENGEFTHDVLSTLIQCTSINEVEAEKVISFLIYYGVLGVRRPNEEPVYIYDVNYDIEMLKVRVRKWSDSARYVLNPALWPALQSKREQPSLM